MRKCFSLSRVLSQQHQDAGILVEVVDFSDGRNLGTREETGDGQSAHFLPNRAGVHIHLPVQGTAPARAIEIKTERARVFLPGEWRKRRAPFSSIVRRSSLARGPSRLAKVMAWPVFTGVGRAMMPRSSSAPTMGRTMYSP